MALGTELVYIVDSAGGMLPSEVRSYIQACRGEMSNMPIGFHGHNNLGLAVANSLICVEEDIELVDTSLQGFGRSAGNTPTEQFLSVLIRAGFPSHIDPIVAMDLGESLIRILIENRGISSLDVTAGQALFHSSNMPLIHKIAKKHRVDPRRLIVELCKHDKINASEELLVKLAQELQISMVNMPNIQMGNYFGQEESIS
jgi:isopropylmalate/homocitrate/citramalate synthase